MTEDEGRLKFAAAMQLNSDVSTILLYLRQVLGVNSAIMPGQVNSAIAPAHASSAEIVVNKKQVLFVLDRPLSSDAQQLLNKMIQAMKLDMELIEIRAREELDPSLAGAGFQQVVFFTEQAEQLVHMGGSICTWSPELLLQRPELKKKAWDDLQLIMKRIN